MGNLLGKYSKENMKKGKRFVKASYNAIKQLLMFYYHIENLCSFYGKTSTYPITIGFQ
jgi:hypothetical protein